MQISNEMYAQLDHKGLISNRFEDKLQNIENEVNDNIVRVVNSFQTYRNEVAVEKQNLIALRQDLVRERLAFL